MSAPFFFCRYSSCSRRAFSKTASASCCIFFRRTRCVVMSTMTFALGLFLGGAMLRNSNSSSRMRAKRRMSTFRFQCAAMRVAAITICSIRSASSFPLSACFFWRSSFFRVSFLQVQTISARLMPMRPRSFFWMIATAWSVDRPTSKGSFLSRSGSGSSDMLKTPSQWSSLCCLSSISSRHSLSSRKYRGTLHSTVSGLSFRSVSTSSSATKRLLDLGL
mmetsp:Transcript_4905/g.13352  ORF Transcript_4905/g.13352 Transcript_4905/m.13352 type:complete len:219 (-) Transcript_4905:308-964(-)